MNMILTCDLLLLGVLPILLLLDVLPILELSQKERHKNEEQDLEDLERSRLRYQRASVFYKMRV